MTRSIKPAISGTCTTCHDTPNVGNHSLPVPLEIGTSRTVNYETDPTIMAAVSQLSMPDLPVFQIVCNQGPNAGEVTYTSDPGKALNPTSGLCSDVGRGKGLVLRGLAARAPYFHNGAAATLSEVVDFYNVRFQMNLTPQEKTRFGEFPADTVGTLWWRKRGAGNENERLPTLSASDCATSTKRR